MSERTQAPRSGGRSAEPQRPANGRRDKGTSRDAETQGGAGRGARRLTEGTEDGTPRRSDTRRSGIRNADAGRERPKTRVTAGRGKVDAPVDGAAALQIEVEPLRATDATGGPRLRVAPPPPIHGGPRAPFAAAVIGLVIVGVLGILLINTKTNENSFRIDDLKKQNTALENQRQDLDQQVVEASSIGNLDAAARRLGLVKAKTEDVAQIRLPDGKIINFHGPATGKRSPTAQEGINEPSLVSPVDGAKSDVNGGTPDGAGR